MGGRAFFADDLLRTKSTINNRDIKKLGLSSFRPNLDTDKQMNLFGLNMISLQAGSARAVSAVAESIMIIVRLHSNHSSVSKEENRAR